MGRHCVDVSPMGWRSIACVVRFIVAGDAEREPGANSNPSIPARSRPIQGRSPMATTVMGHQCGINNRAAPGHCRHCNCNARLGHRDTTAHTTTRTTPTSAVVGDRRLVAGDLDNMSSRRPRPTTDWPPSPQAAIARPQIARSSPPTTGL